MLVLLPNGFVERTPNRVRRPVSHGYLAPTILELAGIPFSHSDFDGKSLLSKVEGDPSLRPVLMEEYHFERKRAVRIGQYKLIQAMDDRLMNCRFCGRSHGDREELFDLESDSQEARNLIAEQPAMLKEMRQTLSRITVR